MEGVASSCCRRTGSQFGRPALIVGSTISKVTSTAASRVKSKLKKNIKCGYNGGGMLAIGGTSLGEEQKGKERGKWRRR